MAKTPKEMTSIELLNAYASSLDGMRLSESCDLRSELERRLPTPPAPIAAQTEKVEWQPTQPEDSTLSAACFMVECEKCDRPDCTHYCHAEQVDAARLALQKILSKATECVNYENDFRGAATRHVQNQWLKDACEAGLAASHRFTPARCPKCGSNRLKLSVKKANDGMLWPWMDCLACGEVFVLDRPETLAQFFRAASLKQETQDNPELDATNGAHPAWWRGHDYTTKVFCQKVNGILDGKDDGSGVASEPWESTRRRLLKQETQPGQIDIRTCTEAEYQNRYGVMAPDLNDLRASSSPLETPAAEPFIVERVGHKRECAGNLRIAITQSMVTGCNPTPWQTSSPVYVEMPACNCGATPAPADTGAENWIRVEDELPKPGQTVDVLLCGDLPATVEVVYPVANPWRVHPFKNEHEHVITHWKPLASTGDTPQPQERKGAALLDWFIAGIRTYTSPDPMPFADETYELRKKIIGYIEAGQNAALGKTPDVREWLYKNGWAESEGCWWHPATDEYGVREIDLPAVLIAYQVFLATPDAREEKEK